MPILIIVNEYPPETIRGTAVATEALAKALAKKGWEVHVVVTCRKSARSEDLAGKVRVYRLSTLGLSYTRTLQRLFGIIRLARRIRPDLVQGQAASCGVFALVVGYVCRIPSITYVQGGDFLESGPIRRFLEVRTAVRYATRTIVVTDELAEHVRPYAAGRVEVIPHGFEPEELSPEVTENTRRRLGTERPNLLCVGYLDVDKGVTFLLSAVAMLKAEWPRLRLHVVGDGELREELESQTVREGTADNVTFYGGLPHSDVLSMMATVDLFVLPSLSAEPFGIVLVEALNEGCPVVATTICGAARIVQRSEGGLLVPPGDPKAIADAIAQLLRDPVRRRHMAQAAREGAEELRWDRNVLRFEKLYRELCKGHR